jgi:hypothetical protein
LAFVHLTQAWACNGVVIGASNEVNYAEHVHRTVTALNTLGALPGLRCVWHSYAVSGSYTDDYLRQVSDAMFDYEDVDVLVVGNSIQAIRDDDLTQLLENYVAMWDRIKMIAHIVVIKYPPLDNIDDAWLYDRTTVMQNVEEFNRIVDLWPVIGVDWPSYETLEDGLHATEKSTYALASAIYAELVANGF